MMKLPVIDKKSLLALEDKKSHIIKKFSTLSDKSLQHLQDANEYAASIPAAFMGKKKTLRSYREDLMSCIHDTNAIKFHDLLKGYSADFNKQKMYQWYVEQKTSLLKQSLWKQFLDACKTVEEKEKILRLRNEWMMHGAFSNYSSQALVELSRNYMFVFKNYLKLLTSEFNTYKSRLSNPERAYIQSYIQTLKTTLKKENRQVIDAMLSRLKLASCSGDIKYDDVTIDLASHLKQHKVLKDSYKLPDSFRRGLELSTITYFQNYIIKNGTPAQKASLARLIWNQPDNNYQVSIYKNNYLVIPISLNNFVRNKNIIERIFKVGENNQKVIQEHYALITQHRFHPKPIDHYKTLQDFHHNEGWQELCSLSRETGVQYELSRNSKPLTLFSRILFKSKVASSNAWQSYLFDQQGRVLSSMLVYVNYITQQLRTRVELGLDLENLCSERFKLDLKHFNEDIVLAINNAGLAADDLPIYKNFTSLLSRVNNLKEELQAANKKKAEEELNEINSIDEFVEWSSINKDPIENVGTSQAFQSPQTEECTDNNPFRPITDENILNGLKTILNTLLTPTRTSVSFESLEEYIGQMEILFNQCSDSDLLTIQNDKEVCGLLNDFIKSYLLICINSNEEDKDSLSNQLQPLEFIVSQLAPLSMQENVSELIRILETECWFVFQAKCYGLLSSFDEENVNESAYLKKLEALLPDSNQNSLTKTCLQQGDNPSTFFHQKTSGISKNEPPSESYTLAY